MVVTSILESKDLTKFFVEALSHSLHSHEERFNLEDGIGTLEHAFKTKVYMDRGKGRGFGGKKGKGGGRSQREDQSQVAHPYHFEQSQQDHGHKWIDKSRIQCHYCKEYGHFKSECRKLQFVQSRNKANVTNTECETSDA